MKYLNGNQDPKSFFCGGVAKRFGFERDVPEEVGTNRWDRKTTCPLSWIEGYDSAGAEPCLI